MRGGTEAIQPPPDARDEDPELVELPDPPRRERRLTLALVAVTAAACLAMAGALARDAAYALRAPERPIELPDLRTAPRDVLGAAADAHACGRGVLGAAGAVRFERAFERDSYRVAPIVGRSDVWVEVRVPAGAEGGRWVPPTTFCGRLVPFERAGLRRRGLAAAVEVATGRPVEAGAMLLVDGEGPAHARWAVALVALFAGCGVWNVVALARLARRVRG